MSAQDLYETKGNDGRNLFDGIIQTRNELKDRAADALIQTKGNDGRNVLDSVIQGATSSRLTGDDGIPATGGAWATIGGTLTYQWSSGRPLLRNEVTLWPLPVKTDTATTWADMGAWPVTWDMCRFTLAELALIRQFSQPTQEGSQG